MGGGWSAVLRGTANAHGDFSAAEQSADQVIPTLISPLAQHIAHAPPHRSSRTVYSLIRAFCLRCLFGSLHPTSSNLCPLASFFCHHASRHSLQTPTMHHIPVASAAQSVCILLQATPAATCYCSRPPHLSHRHRAWRSRSAERGTVLSSPLLHASALTSCIPFLLSAML